MTLAIQGVGWVLEPGINVSKRSHLSLVSYATGLTVLVTLIWPVVEPRAGWARLVARGG